MTWSSPPNDDPAQLSTTTADDDSSSKLQAVGAYTDVGEVPPPTSDRYPLYWQGRIAAAASGGGGLDIFRTALESIKQNVPADRALLAHAQCEIWGAGERHLGDSHGVDVLTAIYFAVFSERPPGTQDELDEQTIARDERAETQAEIRRLAKLTTIEYDHERKSAAERLGISRVGVLDAAVKAARAENGDAKTQGRAPSITEVEPWRDPVNLAETLSEAVTAYSRYLILPAGGAEEMALWSMGTHCFQCFPIFPRLTVTSPEKECAKSLLLRVLKCTTARAVIMTNANIAPLFRMISLRRPSVFLDEGDNCLIDKPDLLALLNDGYAAGGRVWRCDGENNEVKEFDVFAPVAIAMINRPPDTLLSRSIEIRMRRKKRDEETTNFRGDRVAPDLFEIQRKFARAAADHADALRVADPDMGSLFNRDADNWRPMYAIADAAGGKWPQRIRDIAQAAIAATAEQSTREKLLADVRWIFDGKPETQQDGTIQREYDPVDKMSSAEIADHLAKIEGRPWAEWKAGRAITPAALARQLGPFGILSGTVRLDGGRTLKGYKRADFEDVFESYLADTVNQTVTASQSNNDGRCDALQNVTNGQHVTLSETSQPNNDGPCDGVTLCAVVDEEEAAWTL